jgi:hypothetical protein
MKLILRYICLYLLLTPREVVAQELDSMKYLEVAKSYGLNRFTNKKPFKYDDSTVTFFLRSSGDAKAVFLTGNFCSWSDKAFPMTRTSDGWIATVKLSAGKFWYKFIIDGKWKADSDNLLAERDTGGEINSVYYKSNTLFELFGHQSARKVFVAGSFNNWKGGELQMERRNSSWQLPLYLPRGTHAYYFIVDGEAISGRTTTRGPIGKVGASKLMVEIADHNKDLYGSNRFIDGKEFAVDDSIVTFRLRGYLTSKQVYVCGSWVSWVKDSLPMTRTNIGWERNVKLSPGKHYYKFVVDDTWIKDPDNLLHENTSAAAFDNSVFYKTNTSFNLAAFPSANKVFLTGSFNSWNPADLQMNKTKAGWQISAFLSGGTHHYAFIVDGDRYLDPHSNQSPGRNGQVASVIHVNTALKSIAYYQAELAAAEQLGEAKIIAASLVNIGSAYQAIPEHAEAISYFEKALSYFKQLGDFVGTGDVLLKIADDVRFFNDPAHELDLLNKAVFSYTVAKDNLKLRIALTKLGHYNIRSREYYKAIILFKDAMALHPSANDSETAALLGSIAHAYSYTSEPIWQLHFATRALFLNELVGNKDAAAENLLILGDYHRTQLNYAQADSLYRLSLRIYENTRNEFGIAWVKYSRAQLLLKAPDGSLTNVQPDSNKRYEKAIDDLKASLQTFKDHHDHNFEIACLLVISNSLEIKGDFAEAHLYYKKHIQARDLWMSLDKKNSILIADLNYTSERKQDSLRFKNELSDRKFQQQLLLADQQRQRLKLNVSQLALAETEKEVQHLSFLKTQADLENERLIKQKVQREQQLQKIQLSEMTQRSAIASLNQQRIWIYIIGGFILLALGSFYFIYRSKLRNSKLKAELEKEIVEQRLKEADFQRKLADISMSALRSQMNPHFIFNCLNSIKYYTVQNDTVAASEYLTKFSKLIRLVLENSRNDRITLSSELAALELYIQMEAMRFKEKLKYSITVATDVEADYFEIPPLLLQPFVENAIWHGLMHKEEGGKIDIAVSTAKDGSALQIVISDNGIGRKKASELKNKVPQKHKSYAMQATSERIALVNQIYKSNAVINVLDLVDEYQQGSGTQITIQIGT